MSKMLPPSPLGLFLYECYSSWKLADDIGSCLVHAGEEVWLLQPYLICEVLQRFSLCLFSLRPALPDIGLASTPVTTVMLLR